MAYNIASNFSLREALGFGVHSETLSHLMDSRAGLSNLRNHIALELGYDSKYSYKILLACETPKKMSTAISLKLELYL